MSSSPPHKRKRTHSQSDSETSVNIDSSTLTRSPDIYLKDGNIVLVAENVAFRVHKSQLARHSEVFRDMFTCVDGSIAQPEDAESFDGCQVVRLSDGSNDVQVLLEAIYDNMYSQLDSEELGGNMTTFQMSRKYLIEPLRVSALGALLKMYPDNLKDWESTSGNQTDYSDWAVQQPNVDILVPAAYYNLCSYRSDDLMFEQPLPLPYLKTMFRGRERLSIKFAQFIDRELVDRKGGNHCLRACREALKTLEKKAHRILRQPNTTTRPTPLSDLAYLLSGGCTSRMCKQCRQKIQAAIKKEREAIWESLPEIFGLGTWEELRKEI